MTMQTTHKAPRNDGRLVLLGALFGTAAVVISLLFGVSLFVTAPIAGIAAAVANNLDNTKLPA